LGRDAKRNHPVAVIAKVGLRPPRSPLGEQLAVDGTGLIFTKAFLKQRPQPIDAEVVRASVVGTVEKRTVRSMLCHVLAFG
jgi:hypothetical protein